MAIYELYCINAETIQEAKLRVENSLSITFVEHESSYHRGPYFVSGKQGSENFEIKLNIDPFEDVPNEHEFPYEHILLYVNNTQQSEKINSALTKENIALLLRREDL
jgi:hypothetical protein